MPLPLPRLDTRTFDQLFDEGRLTLPRLAPGWTDHNYHDPGITLIDLFAWLVEMDIYRLDRTSPAAYRAFLRLVGIETYPPQVAETVVTFNLSSERDPIFIVRNASPQIIDETGRLAFQLTRNLTVLPVRLTAVLGGSKEARVDYARQNQANEKRFAAFGSDPSQDNALYLGFDAPLKKTKKPSATRRDTQVSLYIWVDSPEKDLHLRQRIIEECRAERTLIKNCEPKTSPRELNWRQHYSARTQWEYYDKANEWRPLSRVTDETRGLTLNGAVRFVAPDESRHATGGVPAHTDEYFIRCRLTSGYYECPPEIQFIAINAAPARHAIDINAEEKQINTSGRARQTIELQHKPVVAGTVRLSVKENGTYQAWVEAPDWDRVGPHCRAFLLSAETGEIVFGDGRHGRVPKANTGTELEPTIKVIKYQVGGGASGNVPAGTLTEYLGDEKITVQQPFAATGGADAESLEDAKGRAVAWLEEPRRAVTLKDFEELVLKVPGVPVARACAIPDYDPTMPCIPALGNITVVIVPLCARPLPEPGPDMLRAVEHYLDMRRTLTGELHVMSPSFITVAVHAQLHTEPETDAQNLIVQAKAKLDAFLDPLNGGQDGKGWPIGRDVYRSEIMALLNSIPGVTHVDEVGLLVEAELETYAGFITFKRVIQPNDVPLLVQARLCVERSVIAYQLVESASSKLEEYIRSQRGWLKHRKPETQRQEIMMVLRARPDVIHVEEVNLSEQSPDPLCDNVSVCAHSLVISGKHEITVSGALKKGSTRVSKTPC
jgi:predicted phage baseplate assembly protein